MLHNNKTPVFVELVHKPNGLVLVQGAVVVEVSLVEEFVRCGQVSIAPDPAPKPLQLDHLVRVPRGGHVVTS
jgi:hypothetical protein